MQEVMKDKHSQEARTYISRWCSSLGLGKEVRRACQSTLDNMAHVDLRSLSQVRCTLGRRVRTLT